MGPLGPAIIGGIASIGGALIGGKGQADANAANAAEAQRNRDFQERMRSTQYQTAVDDMRKAGLNPALAYQQGGAGTPTGSTAQAQNVAAGAGGAAADALQAFQSLRKTAAEIELLNNQSLKAGTEAQLVNQEMLIRVLEKHIAYGTQASAIERIKAEARSSVSTAREAGAAAQIRELAIPEADAIANFYRSAIGKLDPYINSASGAAGAIGKLIPFLSRTSKGRTITRGRSLQRH